MGLDREARRGIQKTEGMVYEGTGASGTGLRQENANGSRCVRLCNNESIVNGVQRWIMETGGIPLKILEQNQEKL